MVAISQETSPVWKTSSNTRRTAWRDSACLLSSYCLEQQPSTKSWPCRRQIPTDENVKKMNGNVSWHSYRQHPRPSSNSWNATVLRNVVPTTDVSVAKQSSNAQTFVLVLEKKNSATMLMMILWSNLTTVAMKMMSKSEDNERWTAQLYRAHNWSHYID